jgi:acyl transferase domain-containing protein/thioesterase domain-containing protein
VSGRTDAVADAAAQRLADHLDATGADDVLGDSAHTLLTGRRAFAHRRAVSAKTAAEAAHLLRGGQRTRLARAEATDGPLDVVLCFPGGGSQYAGMGGGLLVADERFAVYRDVLAEVLAATRALSGPDVRPLLLPAAEGTDDERAAALRNPSASLPAVFAVEVALARQLMAWGIRPRSFVGHSLGEYAAAHLAGVLDLPDAVELVVRRADMMERVSGWRGTMATIALGEEDLRARLGTEVSLAAVNAVDECVVSGPTGAVDELLSRLAADEIESQRIPLSAAAHSSLLDPILPEFATAVRGVTLRPPTLPYASNLSGTWITPEQACDPDAWVAHLRGTVRFADGLRTALAGGPAAVIEVGPGRTLTSYARRLTPGPRAAVATMRHVKDAIADDVHLLDTLGHLWAAGVDADWPAVVTTPGRRRRVVLPTYPFERVRHWIEPGDHPVARSAPLAAEARPDRPRAEPRPVSEWASEPTWTALPTLPGQHPAERWLIVADPGDPVAPQLATALTAAGAVAVEILGPDQAPAAAAGADAVAIVGGGPAPPAPETALAAARHRWLGTAVEVLRAAGEHDSPRIGLVTLGAWSLPGDGAARAAEALAVGPATVARAEYPHVRSSAIDLPIAPTAADLAAAAAELVAGNEPVVALRAGVRYGRATTPCPFPPAPPVVVPAGTTWLVTGGLGAVGSAIAARLARWGAALVLTSSAPLPDDPAAWRRHHGPGHPTTQKLDRLDGLTGEGVAVRVETCDVADPGAVRGLLDRLDADGVELAGVVHAAGALADRALALLSADEIDPVLGAKAGGALVLADELSRRRSPATLVLTSSTSTILAPGGQAAYVAANSVLDALAGDDDRGHIVTVQWGVWSGEGMAAAAAERSASGLTAGRLLEHPVLHELATDRNGNIYARGALTSRVWAVDQHRLADGDVAVLPGTAALELLLSALDASGEPGAGVADVSLLAPLVVPDERLVPVRVVIDAAGKAHRSIRLDAAPDDAGLWRTYVEGIVAPDAALVAAPAPAELLDSLVPDLLALPRTQLHLGARWQIASDVRRGDIEARASVAPIETDEGWRFDPAIADLAVAAGVTLLDGGGLWVPAMVESVWAESVRAPQPTAAPGTVHARRRPASSTDDDTSVVDLLLAAADGHPLVHIQGLTLRRVASSGTLAGSALPPATPEAPRLGGPLLALTMHGGIRSDEGGDAFERVLASDKSRVIVSSVALEALADSPAPEPADVRSVALGIDGVSSIDLVTSLWEELLGVAPIGPDDDFFELGGHSLIAVRVVAAIQRRVGVRLGLAALIETPTPAKLAGAIDSAIVATEAVVDASVAEAAAVRRPLVPVKPTGTRRPFFVVHGAGGNVVNLWTLARHFSEERPLWGFQAHGNDGLEDPDPTIEAMATRYVQAMRCVQAHGPYLVGGYSGGGIVALEMAKQIGAVGERVDIVVLFDTYRPEFRDLHAVEKVRNVVGNARDVGLGETASWLKEVVGKRVGRKPAGSADAMPEIDIDLAKAFSDTVKTYDFGTYPVDALLLRAKPMRPTLAHDYRWKGTITGRIIEHKVAGDHMTLFSPEHAEALAAIVTDALDDADRAARPHQPGRAR